ncbi:glycosyltransferase family 2 protein [Flavobacterium sp.]|jgi:glycosyltransferase involved in cell wall biosynthesis|uniref:glycosyltransferase family 2 protein n=1 Tax=Flavobacterium sp. TaxID=239 RepID=UPI0037C07D43
MNSETNNYYTKVPEISIIIPVYNSEKYLEKCIKSLLDQTFTNCEFIFVNDGSTDRSQIILEDFKKKDNRIVLINQKNQGVSTARNTGISIAKGKYIGFVDADDYVAVDFFNQLLESAIQTNSQIVISGFNTVINDKFIVNQPIFEIHKQFKSNDIKQYILPFFIEQDLMNTVWNKLYDSKLIRNNNVIFPVGITNGEDGLFNIQAFFKSESAYFIDYNGYFYREVKNSATRNLIKNDYFKIALYMYNLDYEEQFGIAFQDIDLDKLKSKRLLNSVFSLLHIYLNPKNGLSFTKRYHYAKKMVTHPVVEKIITTYWDVFYLDKPKYYKYLLQCIKLKSVFGLLAGIIYSNFKNKKR